ncbi:uncharacterized protein LOC121336632 [Onychostruthus taczanowskii]|uniref:uncharacterized protein LOC121336632 n=1 Tax=Onychostruthus taczanowskii TaxID=356909 RepID=UPI001B80A81B|nr:uncharacterized protein LOC121336632 [Onychostruthus taczanowskii]
MSLTLGACIRGGERGGWECLPSPSSPGDYRLSGIIGFPARVTAGWGRGGRRRLLSAPAAAPRAQDGGERWRPPGLWRDSGSALNGWILRSGIIIVMLSPALPRKRWCVLQPVAGLRRDLSSPGLRAGGDGEDLRHFPARGRGEPAGRLGRRRLPAPEHRGAPARGGGDRARLDGACGAAAGREPNRDAKLAKGQKCVKRL